MQPARLCHNGMGVKGYGTKAYPFAARASRGTSFWPIFAVLSVPSGGCADCRCIFSRYVQSCDRYGEIR